MTKDDTFGGKGEMVTINCLLTSKVKYSRRELTQERTT